MIRTVAKAAAGLVAVLLVLVPSRLDAQVSLNTLGSPYTQSFDALPASGSATWTNNSTIAGWYHARTGTGTTIVANNGSSNAGNLYSYGTGTATDRALGSVGSGNAAVGNLFWGVRLQNNTGATITQLDVAYTGEQWRNSAAAAQTVAFSYLVGSPTVTGSLAEFQSAGVLVANLDFTSPVTGGTAGALDGNAAANRTAISFSITGLSIPNGTEVMLRWSDPDHTGADHGLAIDEFAVTPIGAAGGTPSLSIDDVSLAEGDGGPTIFNFTVSLSAPAGPGGVTFDIATADGTATIADNDYVASALVGQSIPSGSSTFPFGVTVNGDVVVEPDQAFFVNVTNVTGATVGDGQGQGTILNDDIHRIHDVQGNGPSSPLVGQTVTVEGVVVGDYQTQGSGQLRGFFLEEEDADHDADPATSEGIFVFCSTCPTAVAEGERVRATGVVSEFFGMTQITATTAGSVVVVEAGNHLADVTPVPLDLPVVTPTVDAYYEPREGMRVTFVDTLAVSEYFNLFRYGTITLVEGGRPFSFTALSAPSVAGYAAHLDDLARRVILLDDENNAQNWPLLAADGSQYVFHPRANGGLSVGTQGVDFFRGGDQVTGLTGVLHWSFSGSSGTDAWRIRPTAANPVAFTVANPRPPVSPLIAGPVRAASFNLLNYFTTVDAGPDVCGPAANQDCRGADSVAELARQRDRDARLLCGLGVHVIGLAELENTTATGAIADLVGAMNAQCGGANPWAFVNTGGTLGTDAIRVGLVYRSATLGPVGAPLVDLDPVHDRPPTAQTFDVIDPTNPAFGQRFTAAAVHFKSKGCGGATGADADQNDGQGCYNARRSAQATRLLAWVNGTVQPAAGDPDVLLLGDFNFYAQEDPAGVLAGGGYVDLAAHFGGPNVYSYVFDGQLGRFDYAWASASLAADSAGAGVWHVDADEVPLFDYSDEVADAGESSFEEKPDGSALVPPRVVFQPASPFRASDHDPVVAGLFLVADLSVTKTDAPDPVTAGTNLVYTVTVANAGPDAAANASWSDTLPAGITFVSLTSPAGWSCSTPAVGAGGTVSCSAVSFPVGSAVFTLTVQVDVAFGAGVLASNTATVTSATADGNLANNSATAATTVLSPATVSATKTVAGTFIPGSLVTYTVVLSNAGPATQFDNPGDEFVDVLPAELTLVAASADSGTAFADLGTDTVTWNGSIGPGGTVTIVIEATIDYGVADGTVIANQGTAHFDGNGDGTNEATAPTDDPATGTPDDPTELVVSAAGIQEIPTLDTLGLALLALLLAALAARRLQRAPR